jgi:hypothetical protein
MPDPILKIEFTTDVQKTLDDFLAFAHQSLQVTIKQKMSKLDQTKEVKEIYDSLLMVSNECKQMSDQCKKMSPLHKDAAAQTDFGVFFEKFKLCKAEWVPIHAFVGAQVKNHKLDLPPLTDAKKTVIKSAVTPDLYNDLMEAYDITSKTKANAQKLFSITLKNHMGLIDIIKQKLENQQKAKANGEIHPAPIASKPILSSSYEAKNQNSQNQAQAIKAGQPPRGAPLPPSNPNAKK